MSKLYFNCTNKQCQPENWGTEIINIPEEHEEHIKCPTCGQKFLITKDKSVLAVFDEEPLLIDSLEAVSKFSDKYAAIRLDISTLHLKGISDNENFTKTISFKDCFIEKLIIEDVNLVTSCFPISFNSCHINELQIKNTRISEDEKKDFWGPLSFFGINFNKSIFYFDIGINAFVGEIIFRSCEFKGAVKIADSKLETLALINNIDTPEIEIENSTIANRLIYKAENEAGPPLKKNQKIIDEYVIEDKENGGIFINDLHIKNFVLPESKSSSTPVTVCNCKIENLKIPSKLFNGNLKFKNCQFVEPVMISGVSFQNLLAFEICQFDQDLTLNELHIGNDLHLSYSIFGGHLNINHSHISGYLTMHMADVGGTFTLERVTVDYNITMINLLINRTFLDNAIIQQTLFIQSSEIHDDLIFKNSTIGDLDISKSFLQKEVSLSGTKIKMDFRCNDNLFLESLSISACDIKEDIYCTHNTFIEDLNLIISKFSSIYLLSNRNFEKVTLNACTISGTTRLNNNIYYQEFLIHETQLNDQVYANNYFLTKLNLNDADGDDILLEENHLVLLDMNNVVSGRFEMDGNTVDKTDIAEMVCNKKFSIRNSIFLESAEIYNSRFVRSMVFSKCRFDDFVNITSNYFGNALSIFESEFDEGEQKSHLFIHNNEIVNSLQINSATFKGKTEILKNNIGQEADIRHIQFNLNAEEDDTPSFEKGFWIMNNNLHHLQLIHIEAGDLMYCENNLITGKVELGDASHENNFKKPVSISYNRARAIEIEECQFESHLCCFNNHIEGGLSISNANITGVCDISGSYVGGSAIFANIDFSIDLILDNTFFDKRLEFRNSYPESVSFRGATLHGFNIPDNWKMSNGRLCSQTSNLLPVIIDERVLREKRDLEPFTYQVACDLIFSDQNKLKALRKNWRVITSTYAETEIDYEKESDEVILLLYYQPVINQLLRYDFYPLFYNFIDQSEVDQLKETTIELSKKLEAGNIGNNIIENMLEFCSYFLPLLTEFNSIKNGSPENNDHKIKPILYERLQDQYLTVKEIFGNNGDLTDEDKAYFRRMHYKNLFEFQTGNWKKKISKVFNWVVLEKIFGWGVDFGRIIRSTFYLIFLFAGIYWTGGLLNPELSILWDGDKTPIANMGLGNMLLLSLQTTFAAFMGDWSPAGLGVLKVWMTINAVLGVLMVAFLIGAYGRKMLR